MWTKLIELILQWWKDKPRKDVVRALVHLRQSMSNCQQWYDKLQAAKKKGNIDRLRYPNPRVEWVRSVGQLGRAIEQIDQVLSVFSPEARDALQKYRNLETLEAVAEGVLATTAKALSTDVTDINIEKGKLGRSFKAALNNLDTFIRTTFKVEEVHAATRSMYE